MFKRHDRSLLPFRGWPCCLSSMSSRPLQPEGVHRFTSPACETHWVEPGRTTKSRLDRETPSALPCHFTPIIYPFWTGSIWITMVDNCFVRGKIRCAGCLHYSRRVQNSRQHITKSKDELAYYITILRKIQILTFEQSVSRVVNPFLIPYLPILQMPRVEKSDSCNHPYVQSDE